ncbi:MAG: hypothetical protein EU551_03570 [Promethearchaeota archaeon]|nr:MAG: hypothetical protein EU551_03570 [Candidatus Lokiarchaeota archaeon]
MIINIICISLLVFELFIIFKYPNFAETLGIYFSVKSLYIIRKTGRTLFTHNFKKLDNDEDLVYSDTFMIGGFISSLGNGLKKAIQLEGEPSLIDIGDYKLLFKYGKFLIGVLLITAVNEKLKSKLEEFISKFEEYYESKDIELDRFIHEHDEDLNNLVDEIFGKFIE